MIHCATSTTCAEYKVNVMYRTITAISSRCSTLFSYGGENYSNSQEQPFRLRCLNKCFLKIKKKKNWLLGPSVRSRSSLHFCVCVCVCLCVFPPPQYSARRFFVQYIVGRSPRVQINLLYKRLTQPFVCCAQLRKNLVCMRAP